MKTLWSICANVLALILILNVGCGDSIDSSGTFSPEITAVSPDLFSTKGGDLVTLTGQHFSPFATVKIGGIQTATSWVSDTELHALVPANPGKQGFASVEVINPDLTFSSKSNLLSYSTATLRFDLKQSKFIEVGDDDPRSMAIGDVDGDGSMDIVYTNSGVLHAKRATVEVILGRGGQTSRFVNFVPSTDGIALADVTSDGVLDVILGNVLGNEILVLPGQKDGTFGATKNSMISSGFASLGIKGINVEDIDKDGKLDVVVANSSANTIAVALGNGDGTFGPDVTMFPAGAGPTMVLSSDVDGDGRMDIFTNRSAEKGLDLFLNKSDFHKDFLSYLSIDIGDPTIIHPKRLALGDLNGDKFVDFVTLDGGTTTEPSHIHASISLGQGDGTFKFPTLLSFEPQYGAPFGLELVDLDGDRNLDLLILTEYSILIFQGQGQGRFGPAQSFGNGSNFSDIRTLRVADMDGDGKSDLVVSNSRSSYTPNLSASIEILYNTSL